MRSVKHVENQSKESPDSCKKISIHFAHTNVRMNGRRFRFAVKIIISTDSKGVKTHLGNQTPKSACMDIV